MWELDHKEGWAPNNWCFWIVVLEKTFESPLDSKEIKTVNPNGNQSWIHIGRTDVKSEAPILWHLLQKDPDAGKDWGKKEKGAIEDEVVGWHHQLSGHEFEQTLGDSEGQGNLAHCSPRSCRELDMKLVTEQQLYIRQILPVWLLFRWGDKFLMLPMTLSSQNLLCWLIAFCIFFRIFYSIQQERKIIVDI